MDKTFKFNTKEANTTQQFVKNSMLTNSNYV